VTNVTKITEMVNVVPESQDPAEDMVAYDPAAIDYDHSPAAMLLDVPEDDLPGNGEPEELEAILEQRKARKTAKAENDEKTLEKGVAVEKGQADKDSTAMVKSIIPVVSRKTFENIS